MSIFLLQLIFVGHMICFVTFLDQPRKYILNALCPRGGAGAGMEALSMTDKAIQGAPRLSAA